MKGRKLGVLVTDGTDAALLRGLIGAAEAEGMTVELVGPKIAGLKASDGAAIQVQQKITGGPSVLYDAIAVLPSQDGAVLLSREATAKDFVNDAYAHAKFIAYTETARLIFEKAGLNGMDGGCKRLTAAADAKGFIEACRHVRFWEREEQVHAI